MIELFIAEVVAGAAALALARPKATLAEQLLASEALEHACQWVERLRGEA